MIDMFYQHRDSDRIESLGDHYQPQDRFDHSTWVLIASLDAEEDGAACRVYETRMPARFWKLVVDGRANYMGQRQRPVTAHSGSGKEMGELMGQLAVAVSQGMVTLES